MYVQLLSLISNFGTKSSLDIEEDADEDALPSECVRE